METLWKITESAATLIEVWIIFEFYTRFHTSKFNKKLQCIVLLPFILVTSFGSIIINTYTSYSGMFTYLCIGIIILYGILFLKGSLFSRLIIPIIVFCMIFVINIIVTLSGSLIWNRNLKSLYTEQDIIRFFSLIITKLLLFLGTRLILAFFKKGVNLKKREWLLMCGILVISLSMGISIVELNLETNLSLSPFHLISFLGIICINIFVFVMLMQISKQNDKNTKLSLLELQVIQQKQAIDQMDIMHEQIRRCNHDHLNHLFCLQELIKNNKYDESNEYLNELIQKNPEMPTAHVNVPNQILRAVLNVKIEQCKKKNIKISLRSDDYAPSCNSVDLCILISNLLDNAIEASESITSPKIEIIMAKQKKYYTIVVKNKIDNSVLEKNAFLKTTKKNKKLHGIGIQSIQEIVKRYNGMMEYYEEAEWFIAHIWLMQ